MMECMDERLDLAIAQVRQESNTAIDLLMKTVQGQLKQSRSQTLDLRMQLQASQASAEPVRLQVVSLGHVADTRRAETTKAQMEMPAQIADLSAVVERDGGQVPLAPPPKAAETDRADPAIPRANTQTAVGRAQVHKVVEQHWAR